MAYACPDCGAPVSERAAVCPQCGFPIRRNAIPQRGGPGAPASGGGGNVAVFVIALVGIGFFVLVVIGILAAIAIPRFVQATSGAKEKEGEMLLRQFYSLEQMYHDQHGAFTRDLADLPLKWLASNRARHYTIQVSAASDRDLCLEAVPKPDAAGQVPALSMDAEGRLYHDAGCTGAPTSAVPVDPATSARGQEARDLLEQGYKGIDTYRRAHDGRLPAGLQEAAPELEAQGARVDYRLDYYRAADGGMCLSARPLSTVEGPERSVDENGDLYIGSACHGTRLERLTGDTSSSSSDSAGF